ncbi:MAG: hypothetical protein AMJ60_05455 [Desulfobacterales bacterium SG8_35]|jgi:hypothetical protein|nr:MAG: hypothetical protein AMJ60_05455 [Desulfobacterales bacterium SG8_35]
MKYRFHLIAAVVGVILIVTGCAHYTLIEAGKKVEVGQAFMVDPGISWSMAKENGVIIWTVDGPGLQRLIFFPGIEDGSPLFKASPGQEAEKMPIFEAAMTLLEVMDLLEATLVQRQFHQIKEHNLLPLTIGGHEGFWVDFSYASKAGLEYKGFAAGAIKERRLYLVMYTGTALHYYEKYAAEAEKIVKSIEFM